MVGSKVLRRKVGGLFFLRLPWIILQFVTKCNRYFTYCNTYTQKEEMSSNNTQKLSEIRKIGMVRGRAFSVAYGDASPCGGL